MIIGVDIDNVIADTEKGLRKYLYEQRGLKIRREDITDYTLKGIPGLNDEMLAEVWEVFGEGDIFLDLEVLEGARETLERLMERHRIILVTSRTESVKEQTIAWLERELIAYDELIFSTETKVNGIPYELFIEDQDKFALELAEDGTFVLLYDAPWNRHVSHENIDRVAGWQDIQRFCFPACATGRK